MAARRERGGKRRGRGWLRRALRLLGPERRDPPGTVARAPERHDAPAAARANEESTQLPPGAAEGQASLDQVLRSAAESRAARRNEDR